MPQIGIETEIAQHIDSFILIEKSKWNVKYFLEGCELEDISDKISIYLKSLEAIAEDKSANEQRNCLQDIEDVMNTSAESKKLLSKVEEKDKEPSFTGLLLKQVQESDDDFQPTIPIRTQKRKKQLSLSKKVDKELSSSRKVKTTSKNVVDPFIASSSRRVRDNSEASSNSSYKNTEQEEPTSISKLIWNPFMKHIRVWIHIKCGHN
ncbi:3016_t:CDS:2 [Rhizophagus irregularis]|nr:3016_t:CDS:2 [Rhizophagus irregularis]